MLVNRCPHVKCIIGTHTHYQAKLVVPIRCKRWTCKFCRACNLKTLLDRIRRGKPNKLLTLTCHATADTSPESLYQSHRPAIRRLLQLIRRNFGPIEACIICELTSAGNPHWHLVCRTDFIPQTWLSRTWLDLTGSRIVDIRKIKDARHAACYVAKYVTKTHGANKPEWLKRVTQFTRYYAPKRRTHLPPDFIWERDQMPPEVVIDRLSTNTPWRRELPCGTLLTDRAEPQRQRFYLELETYCYGTPTPT